MKLLIEDINRLLNSSFLLEGKKDVILQVQNLLKRLEVPEKNWKMYIKYVEDAHQDFTNNAFVNYLVSRIKDLILSGNNQPPKFEKVEKKQYDDFIFSMKHFMSIEYVNNKAKSEYKFDLKTPMEDVLQEMEYFENIWAQSLAKHKKLTLQQKDDKELITFPDGLVWVLLNRGACNEEGAVMGHCGNVPSQKEGDRILSLRKIVDKKSGRNIYNSLLTFILHKNGFLGEMKGFNNSKPDRKYHPYIIKLLEHPIVNGILGGGYVPQNNFSINDLTIEQKQKLIKKKPSLMSIKDAQLLDKKDFIEYVEKQLKLILHKKVKIYKKDGFYHIDDLLIVSGWGLAVHLMGGMETPYYIDEYIDAYIAQNYHQYDDIPEEFTDKILEAAARDFLNLDIGIEVKEVNGIFHLGLDFSDEDNKIQHSVNFFKNPEHFFEHDMPELGYESYEIGESFLNFIDQNLYTVDIEDYLSDEEE